jgi:hypothetical protein
MTITSQEFKQANARAKALKASTPARRRRPVTTANPET